MIITLSSSLEQDVPLFTADGSMFYTILAGKQGARGEFHHIASLSTQVSRGVGVGGDVSQTTVITLHSLACLQCPPHPLLLKQFACICFPPNYRNATFLSMNHFSH